MCLDFEEHFQGLVKNFLLYLDTVVQLQLDHFLLDLMMIASSIRIRKLISWCSEESLDKL